MPCSIATRLKVLVPLGSTSATILASWALPGFYVATSTGTSTTIGLLAHRCAASTLSQAPTGLLTRSSRCLLLLQACTSSVLALLLLVLPVVVWVETCWPPAAPLVAETSRVRTLQRYSKDAGALQQLETPLQQHENTSAAP